MKETEISDFAPEPEKMLELTNFDLEKLKALEIGQKMTTENSLFKIVRSKDNYIITHGNTQVSMPGIFDSIGYMTH